MTILWDTDPAALETYHFAVGEQPQQVETGPLVSRALGDGGDERLVVVGPDIDARSACELAAQIRLERPQVGMVLLRRRLDVTVLAQALRSGVREVVAADDLTAVAAACQRSLEVSAALVGKGSDGSSGNGRVVTVFSAKGGVGKTTVATNLGTYLAASGSKVLLMDLDLAFGDVAISLQLAPKRSTADLVAMTGHLDAPSLASVVTRHESGLDVLCAPGAPADADRIPATTTAHALRVARSVYDYVVVDTPPAFSEHVLAAFDVSDVSILLATLDIPAVKNLRLTLDTLDLLGHPRQSRVIVLNRSDAKVGLTTSDVVAVLKQPIAASIPNSLHVPASVNRGVPIVMSEPKHPVSVALRALADRHCRPEASVPAPIRTIATTAAPAAAQAAAAAEPQRSAPRHRLLRRGGRR